MSCWTWAPDPVLIDLPGPLDVRWYGLFILGVLVANYALLRWQLVRGGWPEDTAGKVLNWAVPGGFLGAWLGHLLFYESDPFAARHLDDIWRGLSGLSSHGMAVGVILGLVIGGRRQGVPASEVLDRVMFGMAATVCLVRLGNFFSSDIVGRPTDVPWAACFPLYEATPVPRHPTQLYEVAMGAFLLAVLVAADRWAGRERRPRWLISGLFFTLYFTLRFLVEFLKEYQTRTEGLTMGQLLSVPFVALGLALLWRSARKESR